MAKLVLKSKMETRFPGFQLAVSMNSFYTPLVARTGLMLGRYIYISSVFWVLEL